MTSESEPASDNADSGAPQETANAPKAQTERKKTAGKKAQESSEPMMPATDAGGGKDQPAPRPPDVATIAIAAILGAMIALAAQYVIDLNGLSPPTASAVPPANSALAARVTAVETNVEALTARDDASGAIAELRRALSVLRQDVATLSESAERNNSDDLPAVAQAVEALERTLTSAEARLVHLESITPDDLSSRLDSFASASAVGQIDVRVTELESNALQNDLRRAALALGLAQLSRAARSSQSFGTELDALRTLRPNDRLIEQLAPVAETGVPTMAMLAARFPVMARQVARAESVTDEQTALGRLWAWVSQAFSFRRTANVEGAGTASVLARAEMRLDEGNLAAAVDELRGLPGGARVAASDWIEAAEGRVMLDQLITSLSAEIIGELEQ